MGQEKAGKVSGNKKKQLEQYDANNKIIRQMESNIIGYKTSILKKQSLSEVKMGKSSQKMSTNCVIPPSTAHNIIQQF